MTDFLVRYEEGIKELKDNDIDVLAVEDVAGWMRMRKAGLTTERRERLIATLPDERFQLEAVKKGLIRLFPELHSSESSTRPGTQPT